MLNNGMNILNLWNMYRMLNMKCVNMLMTCTVVLGRGRNASPLLYEVLNMLLILVTDKPLLFIVFIFLPIFWGCYSFWGSSCNSLWYLRALNVHPSFSFLGIFEFWSLPLWRNWAHAPPLFFHIHIPPYFARTLLSIVVFPCPVQLCFKGPMLIFDLLLCSFKCI